jgi:hypothetical protein
MDQPSLLVPIMLPWKQIKKNNNKKKKTPSTKMQVLQNWINA